MNRHEITTRRPPLESLAWINEQGALYGQRGQNNLIVRKRYGKDGIRYLRCRCCGSEFSERKGTALWNIKVSEERALWVAEHLSEGCSLKGTARLAKVDTSVVRRLNGRVAHHGQAFHEERVRELKVEALEADERQGYCHHKAQRMWEAEIIEPQSKFVLSHVQGRRDEALIRRLVEDSAKRVADRHPLVWFTDGEASYERLFPEIFGQPYRPSRKGCRGRLPAGRYRIPRTLAHLQIVKHRQGRRVVAVDIRYAHGSKKRVQQMLERLGYSQPNTSAIERRNGTARRMSAHQVRKSLALSRRADTKLALGGWGVTVYNWCRPNRSLRLALSEAQGKKIRPTDTGDGPGADRSSWVAPRTPPDTSLPPGGRRSSHRTTHSPVRRLTLFPHGFPDVPEPCQPAAVSDLGVMVCWHGFASVRRYLESP